MGIYAKIKEGVVENMVYSIEPLENTAEDTYVFIAENRGGVAIGESYDPVVGFTTFDNRVLTLDSFQEENIAVDNPDELNRRRVEVARAWRDRKLKETDWVTSVSDHPESAAYTTYRAALRDWPASSDFPSNPPTL